MRPRGWGWTEGSGKVQAGFAKAECLQCGLPLPAPGWGRSPAAVPQKRPPRTRNAAFTPRDLQDRGQGSWEMKSERRGGFWESKNPRLPHLLRRLGKVRGPKRGQAAQRRPFTGSVRSELASWERWVRAWGPGCPALCVLQTSSPRQVPFGAAAALRRPGPGTQRSPEERWKWVRRPGDLRTRPFWRGACVFHSYPPCWRHREGCGAARRALQPARFRGVRGGERLGLGRPMGGVCPCPRRLLLLGGVALSQELAPWWLLSDAVGL